MFIKLLLGRGIPPAFAFFFAAASAQEPPNKPSIETILKLTECSHAVDNRKDCRITIDREAPVTPLPVNLKAGAKATILVKKRPAESITFESDYKDILLPDAAAAIFSAFSPNLKTFIVNSSSFATSSTDPKMLAETPRLPSFPGECVRSAEEKALIETIKALGRRQKAIEKDLKELKASLDKPLETIKAIQELPAGSDGSLNKFEQLRNTAYCQIEGCDTALMGTQPVGVGLIKSTPSLRLLSAGVDQAFKDFIAVQSRLCPNTADAITTDISSLDANQKSIQAAVDSILKAQESLRNLAGALHKLTEPKIYWFKSFSSTPDDKDLPYIGVGRQASIKLSAQDIISNEKATLPTVTLKWATTPFELSLGTLLSSFVDRKFTTPALIKDGQVITRSDKPVSVLTESITRPTIVPLAVAHYRLLENAPRGRRWALLLSGGIGVNPYTASADFATGFSLAYHSLYFSPVIQFSRDLRLTNGLALGQELVGSAPTLPTERYWVRKFAIGITYRAPIN